MSLGVSVIHCLHINNPYCSSLAGKTGIEPLQVSSVHDTKPANVLPIPQEQEEQGSATNLLLLHLTGLKCFRINSFGNTREECGKIKCKVALPKIMTITKLIT